MNHQHHPSPFSLTAQHLIHLLRWSYFCTWLPCDPPPSSGLLFDGGHWNASLKDEQQLSQIKLLLYRYATHCRVLPFSEAGTAGIVMQSRVPQWSSVDDGSDLQSPNIIQQIIKDASIKTLLWIPIQEGGVLELGNTDMVEENVDIMARVLEFLDGDNKTTMGSTMNPLLGSPFDIDLLELDMHLSLRDTLGYTVSTDDPDINLPVHDPQLCHDNINVHFNETDEFPLIQPPQLHDFSSIHSLQHLVVLTPDNRFEQPLHLPTLSDAPNIHGHDTYGGIAVHPLPLTNLASISSPLSPLNSPNSPARDPLLLPMCHPMMLTTHTSWKPGQTSAETDNGKAIQWTNSPRGSNAETASKHSPRSVHQEDDVHNNNHNNRNGVIFNQSNNCATQHMIAERKRRQRQSESFKALKALVPTINKRDKVTILEHSLRYIKQLKDKVEELEKRGQQEQKNIQDTHHPIEGMDQRDKSPNPNHLSDNQDIGSRSRTDLLQRQHGQNYSVSQHSIGPPCTFLLAMSIEANAENTNDVIIGIVKALISKELVCIHLETTHTLNHPNLNLKLIVRQKESAPKSQRISIMELEEWWKHLTHSFTQANGTS